MSNGSIYDFAHPELIPALKARVFYTQKVSLGYKQPQQTSSTDYGIYTNKHQPQVILSISKNASSFILVFWKSKAIPMNRKVSSRFRNQNGQLMDLALEIEAKTNEARQVYFLQRYQLDEKRTLHAHPTHSISAP